MRIALLVALVAASPVAAQGFPRFDWKGTHAFRAVLNKEGYKSVSDFEALSAEPGKSLLVVLGRPEPLDALCESGQIVEFLDRGGALLLATDQRTSEQIAATLSVRIEGQQIESPNRHFRDQHPECPLLVESRPLLGGRNPLFAGLSPNSKVATNRPSFVSRWGLWPSLAFLPVEGLGRARGFPVGRSPLRFAVGGRAQSKGHFLAMADHSVFINEMMCQGDSDNFAFAENVARWLSDGGQRDRALLYDDGVVQSDFNVSIDYADPPVPPQEVLVSVANRFIGNLQREDALNRTLLQLVNHRTLLRTTIFAFTIGLLLWGLYRFLHGRTRVERLPRSSASAALLPDLGRRGEALLAHGNLAEAARELARQTFASLGVSEGPPVVEANGWWTRRTWARRVGRLWSVAVGEQSRVAAADLSRLSGELRSLTDAAAAGALRLDTAAPIR